MFRKEVQKQLAFILFLIFLICMEGVIGYMVIERWELADAFFMTIITLSTVGFEEVRPLSSSGRIFTAVLIVTGMGVFWYAIGRLTSFLIEADIRGTFRRRKMERKLKALHDHIIVCGFGRNGQEAAKFVRGSDEPCVIIDRNPKVIAEHAPDDLLVVEGDAKDEDILLKCNIQAAKGLIATLPDDADNLYIALTARRLNPNLTIVSRATEDESLRNLKWAGADRVVLPDRIGGMRMAMEILDPTILEYMEMLRSPRRDVPRLGQFVLSKDSPLIGQRTGSCQPATLEGCFLVALQRNEQVRFPATEPDMTMVEGDRLVVFGLPDRIQALQQHGL
jgi:voltage-gated potassium channel